ncbi:MAG: hypothetical protein A3J35_04495 [Gammaproteobacteria bacterium RIFCSPLOWO2_02_FULL_52_10]|nr:MAG: hypothetical protein A3J35_04495 [Gammaproteobacteria bacterium RIFCSPLOWO2_02_FULL_52_10]
MEWVVFFSLVFLAFITFVVIVVVEFKRINFTSRYYVETQVANDKEYFHSHILGNFRRNKKLS